MLTEALEKPKTASTQFGEGGYSLDAFPVAGSRPSRRSV